MRSGTSPFVPRARLLKLLGGELIRDDVMAINELVKNAHDADATRVTLDFRGVTGEDGEILIADDGHGMDVDILLESWMQPAGSTKSRRDGHYTAGGRRVLGEKGVGRFAVDRLGRHAELVSRRAGSDTELVATFNWDEYDDETKLLSEVQSSWTERSPAHFREPGTLLRVTGIRTPWTEKNFRRLSTRLHRLLSPFRNGHQFNIEICSDEFPDYSGTIKTSFLERSPYRVSAIFDGVSTVAVAINGHEPVSHNWNGAGELNCGPVTVTLHGFDLESEAIARVGSPPEVRGWLREWSGISIYRDGFRVLPYGEPDDDWLRLDQRRVNNPVVRLSNNQVCGVVEISRDTNPDLTDQTNRGGLIQSRAFEDLRRLVLFVVQILEAERQLARHPKLTEATGSLAPGSNNGDERSIIAEINEFSESLDGRAGRRLRGLASRLENALETRGKLQDAEVSAYADLAGLGHSVGYLNHSLRARLNSLATGLESLRASQTGTHRDTGSGPAWSMIENCFEEIREATEIFSRVAPTGKRKRRTIDLASELEAFERATVHLLADYGVRLNLEVPDRGLIRCDIPPETLQQVLHILLWNSLEWIEPDTKGRIRISARGGKKFCHLIFQDNGPGISKEFAEHVFEPGFSLKENGRGMGLAIIRHLLSGHGASIQLLGDRRRSGTSFEMLFRRKQPRVT
jgi:signal transduction histidine kinase